MQIESISLESSSSDYGLSAGHLAIAQGASGTPVPIAEIVQIDNLTSSISKLIWGNTVVEASNGIIVTPRKLTLTSGEKLVLVTKSTPSSSITWQTLTRKIMQ